MKGKRRKPKVSYRELKPEREAPAAAPPPEAPVAAPSPELASPERPLPPNRRRDRSRPLTPRELAAVLNEGRGSRVESRVAAPPTSPSHPSTLDPRPSTLRSRSALAPRPSTLLFTERVRARLGAVELLLFRIGAEHFAADLGAVEEAVERGEVHAVPQAPPHMLGVFELRGRLLNVYSPEQLLGVTLRESVFTLLVVRAGDRRIALAIDDVEDVLVLELDTLRDVPAGVDPDNVLLGVAWRGRDIVSLLDLEALLAALLGDTVTQIA